MNSPQTDTVYKTYADAYHAAANLKKRNGAGKDTVIRVEKAPFGRGYVVRATPAFVEMRLLKTFLRFGMKMPGALVSPFKSNGLDFGGKEKFR